MEEPQPYSFCGMPSTHWSLVRTAGLQGPAGAAALSALLEKYLPALRVYLIATRRVSPQEATEFLQGFVADLVLGKNLIAGANSSRGRFRGLLLTSLRHYVSSRRRYENIRKAASLSEVGAESTELESHDIEPHQLFDITWAQELLQQAIAQMEQQCNERNRKEVWGIFEARILIPILEQVEPVSYEMLAQRFTLKSYKDAANILITGKRAFARILRSIISEYELNDADIDAELSDLHKILSESRRKTDFDE